jgi:hypothetical protein
MSSHAGADVRVLIVETRGAPSLPGLAGQVRLHAGRSVDVTTVGEPNEDPLTFAGRASQLVGEHGTTIVVWITTADDTKASRTFLVFAAGRWPGRALIELIRLDAQTPPSEVERTVALKIAGLFATITAPRPVAAALGLPVVEPRPRWFIEVSGSLVREVGDRRLDGRLALSAARRWAWEDLQIAVGLGAHWQPSSAINGDAGVVSIDELGPDLLAVAEHRRGRWSLLARPRVSASLLRAIGSDRDDGRGSATVFSPSVGLDVGARRSVGQVDLTLAVGLDAALIHQQFLIDGEIAADLRRIRGQLSVGVSIPLR